VKILNWSNDDATTFDEQEGAGLGVLRGFDYGLNGTAGFQLDKILIGINYGYGLANCNPRITVLMIKIKTGCLV
jgi:hypothetical protein